jgi:hypothetical protein
MKVLIAGASGAIGRPLIRCLRENRHAVTALVRSPESSRAVAEAGAEPVICQRSMRPTGTSRARCGCSKSLPRRWRGHSSIAPGLGRVLINGPLANDCPDIASCGDQATPFRTRQPVSAT